MYKSGGCLLEAWWVPTRFLNPILGGAGGRPVCVFSYENMSIIWGRRQRATDKGTLRHAQQSGFIPSTCNSLKITDDFPGRVCLINQDNECMGRLPNMWKQCVSSWMPSHPAPYSRSHLVTGLVVGRAAPAPQSDAMLINVHSVSGKEIPAFPNKTWFQWQSRNEDSCASEGFKKLPCKWEQVSSLSDPFLLSIQPLWLCAMASSSQRTWEKDGKGDARLRLFIVWLAPCCMF